MAQAYINGVMQTGHSLNISLQSGNMSNLYSTRLGGYTTGAGRLSGWMDRVKCRIGPLPTDIAARIKMEYEAERREY